MALVTKLNVDIGGYLHMLQKSKPCTLNWVLMYCQATQNMKERVR